MHRMYLCVCVVVTEDYSGVVNEECGQIRTRSVSAAEFSARLLSNGTVNTTLVVEHSLICEVQAVGCRASSAYIHSQETEVAEQ